MKTAALLGALLVAGCSSGVQQQGYTKGYAPKASLHNGAVEFPVHGIDVSKYQGEIDWDRVRGAGTKFAFIKATEGGDHADEKFSANWSGAIWDAQAGRLYVRSKDVIRYSSVIVM